jgi:hypothetical protein
MTQAFNLSQFANSVDSSGKASLTTGVVGTLPIANGGTGTTTPSLVAGTGITITGSFPNQTVAAGASGQGGRGQVFTANGTFTIPTGITSLKVTVVGGGGGGASAPGTSGGAGGTSQVASGTQTITTISATGGGAGDTSGSQVGGIGSNGDLNIRGQSGFGSNSFGAPGSASILGGGGRSGDGTGFGGTGGSYGGGGGGWGGGGGGGAAIKFLTGMTAGNTLAVTIGGAGTAGGAPNQGGAGAAGVVMFEW